MWDHRYLLPPDGPQVSLPGCGHGLVQRKGLAWRLSNPLNGDFCIEALEDALVHYGRPERFNTDQGAQFTGSAFTSVLRGAGVGEVDLTRGSRFDAHTPAWVRRMVEQAR